MVRDPVCGMQVNEHDATAKTEHDGRNYYFCSAGCKQTFERGPQQYTGEYGVMEEGSGSMCESDIGRPGQQEGITGQSHTGRKEVKRRKAA